MNDQYPMTKRLWFGLAAERCFCFCLCLFFSPVACCLLPVAFAVPINRFTDQPINAVALKTLDLLVSGATWSGIIDASDRFRFA
jgi:hypothetical protein